MITIVILLFIARTCYCVIYKLNDSEYGRMPALFYSDDYESCFKEPGAVFCNLEADVVSDTPSQLLTMINEYSMHTSRHFNHSHLYYGLCVKRSCKSFYNATVNLRHVLEACLNGTILEQYQLKAIVADNIHCNTYKLYSDIDSLDILVGLLIIVIIVMNLIGSLYDFFYDKSNGMKILIYFSIRRNWRKLVAPSGEGLEPRLKRLKAFHGIKTATMLMLINAHAVIPNMSFVTNPQYIENLYSDISKHAFLNGSLLTRTYFIVSIFFLTYNLLLFTEKKDLSWALIPKAILIRLIRLTPVYVIVLGWCMTWQRFLGDGLFWHRAIIIEFEHCRRDWWKHLLYINNYFDGSHCNIPSWYLAADTQLYCLALILLVSCRSARSRKLVVSLLFIAGIIIPALHIYFQDLNPFPLSSPPNVLDYYTRDATFNHIYKRGHTNTLNCALGILLALIIYHCQQTNFDVSRFKRYRILFWASPFVCFALVTLGYTMYADVPQVPFTTRLLFSCIAMPALSLVLSAFFWGVVMKFDDVYRCVLEWRGWAAPARVSYCAFLMHAALIRLLLGTQTTLIHTRLHFMLQNGLYVIVMTYIAAGFLYLLVESPFAQLLDIRRKTKSPHSNSPFQKEEDATQLADGNSHINHEDPTRFALDFNLAEAMMKSTVERAHPEDSYARMNSGCMFSEIQTQGGTSAAGLDAL